MRKIGPEEQPNVKVKNIAERIRTDCIDEYMDMIKDTTTNKDKEIARRGENDDQIDDYDPFDEERVILVLFWQVRGSLLVSKSSLFKKQNQIKTPFIR